jgi:hypothetical protein
LQYHSHYFTTPLNLRAHQVSIKQEAETFSVRASAKAASV